MISFRKEKAKAIGRCKTVALEIHRSTVLHVHRGKDRSESAYMQQSFNIRSNACYKSRSSPVWAAQGGCTIPYPAGFEEQTGAIMQAPRQEQLS